MRAIEKDTGVEVAIKIVDRQKYAPTDKSYEREFQVLSTLYHENIINLRCTYVTEKNVFMVTEVVHGGELLERITEEGSYSEADARRIIVQILKAVEYLHSKKVVHRDIKLENILMSDRSPKATVKLIDFGLRLYAGRSDRGIKLQCCSGYSCIRGRDFVGMVGGSSLTPLTPAI